MSAVALLTEEQIRAIVVDAVAKAMAGVPQPVRAEDLGRPLARTTEWRAAPRGQEIVVGHASDAWMAEADLFADAVGRLFLASEPPFFVHDGVRYVPRSAFNRFASLARPEIEHAVRLAEEHERERWATTAERFEKEREAERRARSRVYFIRSSKTGSIKIGYSANVDGRLADLQVAAGHELTLMATMPGDRFDERDLHERFAALRVRGEWFRDDPELLNFIASVRGSG